MDSLDAYERKRRVFELLMAEYCGFPADRIADLRPVETVRKATEPWDDSAKAKFQGKAVKWMAGVFKNLFNKDFQYARTSFRLLEELSGIVWDKASWKSFMTVSRSGDWTDPPPEETGFRGRFVEKAETVLYDLGLGVCPYPREHRRFYRLWDRDVPLYVELGWKERAENPVVLGILYEINPAYGLKLPSRDGVSYYRTADFLRWILLNGNSDPDCYRKARGLFAEVCRISDFWGFRYRTEVLGAGFSTEGKTTCISLA